MPKRIPFKNFGELHLATENHQVWQSFILEQLNKEFKAASVEKYEDAMISYFFQEGLKRFHKGNKSISDHTLGRIQKFMTERMKAKYGPYVNVLRKKDWFGFNFSNVFKTDYGRIYSTSIENLFVTSHCIERFEERLGPLDKNPSFVPVFINFKKEHHTPPTAYDLLSILIRAGYEFGFPQKSKSFFFNIGYGILIVDLYRTFCLAITFLTSKMTIPSAEWVFTGPVKLIGETSEQESSIDGPTFLKDDY